MKNLKNKKGITLIALVITIVVLLILAMIAIRTFSDGGIIDKTNDAKEDNAKGKLKEKIALAMEEWKIENVNDDKTDADFKTFLQNKLGVTITGETSPYTILLEENGVTLLYTVNKNGTYQEKSTSNTTGWTDNGDGTFTKGEVTVAIGNYVNYTPDTDTYSIETTYSGYSSNQNLTTDSLQWKVLGISSSGELELISETPTEDIIYLKGALGYNNGVNILNVACETMYSKNGVGTARSISIEDIEKHYTEDGIERQNMYNTVQDGDEDDIFVDYGTTKTFIEDEDNECGVWYPAIYEQEIGAGINTDIANTTGLGRSDKLSALTTLGKKYAGIIENEGTDDETRTGKLTITQTYYFLDTEDGEEKEYIDNTAFKEMIFGTDSSYWIASRYTRSNDYYISFGLFVVSYTCTDYNNLFNSYDDGNNYFAFYLRPVVTLTSDISLESSGTANTWNISQ